MAVMREIDKAKRAPGNKTVSFTNKEASSIKMAGLKYDARAERRSWAAMKDLFDEAFAA